MIAIRKGDAPPSLVRAGEEHAKELCAAYDADPELYRSGKRTMDIRRSIYASNAVKKKLKDCHHGKCCYCETWIPKFAYSEVEHWRPKSSYFWLAYSWENLLLSCSFCNKVKADLFPLEDPAARATEHWMSVYQEKPAILKPDGGGDPRDHIKFVDEKPVGLTTLGCKTIEVLGLASEAHEPRLTHLTMIRKACEWSRELMDSIDPKGRKYSLEWRALVEDAVRPDQPYSAMVADYLKANPLPDRSA